MVSPEPVTNENEKPSGRPRHTQRKSSFSDTLNKFTNTTFHRRRNTTFIPNSASSASIYQQSRLPTPSGIPRTTSFFSSLNTLAPRAPAGNDNDTPDPPPVNSKRSRRISDRLAQTPFFSHQNQCRNTAAPVTPSKKRDSGIRIEHRGLMQPVHPPLPRSSTMGNLLSQRQSQSQQATPPTPGYMSPTSSTAARRHSNSLPKDNNTSPPLARVPQSPDQIPNRRKTSNVYPARKDSLFAPCPARATVTTSQQTAVATKAIAPLPSPEYSEDESAKKRDQQAQYGEDESAMTDSENEDEEAAPGKVEQRKGKNADAEQESLTSTTTSGLGNTSDVEPHTNAPDPRLVRPQPDPPTPDPPYPLTPSLRSTKPCPQPTG